MAKITVKGRLLNNAIFTPKTDEVYGKTQFSSLVVLEPGEVAKLEAAKQEALKDTFGSKIPAKLADWVVREGDDPEYEQTFEKNFINAKSNRAPSVVIKENGNVRALDPDEDKIYSGVYVFVSIDVYAYAGDSSKKSPPGVTTGLRAVMFWKHGDRLGNVVKPDEEFSDFESEDTDEELAA